MTSFEEYAVFVRSRAKVLPTREQDMVHAAMGMSTEAGEILDTMKKVWVYEQALVDKNKEGQRHHDNLVEEAGDLMFYLVHMLNLLGVPLQQVITINVDKLMKRYPLGYSDVAAFNRADKK